MPAAFSPWIESFQVRSYEADAGGIATPASLCNYLQEAAGNHAFALKVSVEQLHDRNLTWMLSRLRLEMDRLPSWRDTVVVETWPSGTRGPLAIREFLLRDEKRLEIGRASTAWLLIDVNRRRPSRLPPDVLALRHPDSPSVMPFPSDRLDGPAFPTIEEEVAVHWSDMDVNEHVNNVRYVSWAVDTLPQSIVGEHRLTHLAVDFIGETRVGDRVRVRTGMDARSDQTTSGSEILLNSDGTPVARVVATWKPAS